MTSVPQVSTERKTQHPNGRELAALAIVPPADQPAEFSPPPLTLTDDDAPPIDLVVAPAQAPAVKIPTANVVNAAELLTWQFDPLQWTIEGILPAGCYLLAGRPKVGKSWLGLALAIAVASGGRALGHAAVNQGDVLYLGLEDSHRRLHDRIEKLLDGDAAGKVARLDVITECPRLSDGGELIVEGWLDNHPAAKLVIVDTLQRFRPRRQRGTDPYESDYEALQALLAITKRRDVTVVVVHHLRKMSGGDDVFDLVSGTLGLTGAVDGSLVLQRVRGKSDATLHVTGRDLPQDLELGLAWDQTTATWRVAGSAEELRLTRLQFVIFSTLRDEERPMSPAELHDALKRNQLDTSYDTLKTVLSRMAGDGKLFKVGRGLYTVSDQEEDK